MQGEHTSVRGIIDERGYRRQGRLTEKVSENGRLSLRLLSKQDAILTDFGANRILGEHKVSHLFKYGFLKEISENQTDLTELGVKFLNGEIAYPAEAISEAQVLAKTELYCSDHLTEVLLSLGVSDDYRRFWRLLCRHSPLPGGVKLNKPHLELPITTVSEKECLRRLSAVQGYFFGRSHRSTPESQFTIIIVDAL